MTTESLDRCLLLLVWALAVVALIGQTATARRTELRIFRIDE